MERASQVDIGERLKYAPQAQPAVEDLLQEAAQCFDQTNRAEAILWTAQAIYPQCLQVYFALYKFYFYKLRLQDAERAARLALQAAAWQAGFDPDWHHATASTADWGDALGPQHFYLFSLKALAFICLRRGKAAECQEIMAKLAEIDPDDSVGAEVIQDLANATSN